MTPEAWNGLHDGEPNRIYAIISNLTVLRSLKIERIVGRRCPECDQWVFADPLSADGPGGLFMVCGHCGEDFISGPPEDFAPTDDPAPDVDPDAPADNDEDYPSPPFTAPADVNSML